MCELFAMSARRPTDVNHSLALLQPRGGDIGPHADGWGVAFYEGKAARIFKEPIPAAESQCLAFITEYDFSSSTVIAHIRKANPEKVGRSSANTHPFERELAGRSWVFAHNGKLPGIKDNSDFTLGRFNPLGDTDSEYAFCLLLDEIARLAGPGNRMPSANQLAQMIRPLVKKLSALGEFNFMLSDGECLIVHAHTRMNSLCRSCLDMQGTQKILLLATVPLTDEPWQALPASSMHVYKNGVEISQLMDA
ncbi:Putative glutamine amidotransferase YafJ [hydrothermal vent metagenome]|uniref:Glutamine amidotransferase YafJ n=1 Tax=hydrothermal vent metagenome TaxID=652676 RepID=A0A3B0TXD5_9ZZZZ